MTFGLPGPLLFPPALGRVPALTGWGMALLGLLLAMAAILLLRRRAVAGGGSWPAVVIVVAAAITSVAAATILLDGSVDDWAGTPVFAADPGSDAVLGDPSADLLAVFVAEGSLFFRIDVQDLEQDPPVAVDDEASTAQNNFVDIDVLANDNDVEGPLTVVGFTQGSNGAVTDQGGGVLRYNPNPLFVGPDQFTYQVEDGGGLPAGAMVQVTVVPPGGPPIVDLNGQDPGRDFAIPFDPSFGPVPIVHPAGTVFDPDGVLQILQVTITNPLDTPQETLNADASGTAITPTYNPGTGVLQLIGPDSTANFTQVLRTIIYFNEAPSPNPADRFIVFVANDGTSNSNMPSTTLMFNPPGP